MKPDRRPIHKGCGGRINGALTFTERCVCEKCGASSYFLIMFPGGTEGRRQTVRH